MNGLPFLPGMPNYQNKDKTFHKRQTLGYKNGYALSRKSTNEYSMNGETDLDDDLMNFDPQLTYGQAKPDNTKAFVPAYVAWDKKVLSFDAWFAEYTPESAVEVKRVRRVKLFYYLEDDTISIYEPVVKNSGLTQGKLVKRQRLAKDSVGNCYNWKDLNNGLTIVCFGITYNLFQCDIWTQEFLESEGIQLNQPLACPVDSYTLARHLLDESSIATSSHPSEQVKVQQRQDWDKLEKFLRLDRQVLRFDCRWEGRKYVLHYFLVDDSIEIREVHSKNDGMDPFPMFMSRRRVPLKKVPLGQTGENNSGLGILNIGQHELETDHLKPSDLSVGGRVWIFGRNFDLLDCDNFTKAFYWHNYGIEDFFPASGDVGDDRWLSLGGGGVRGREENAVPPYTGLGSLEDSLQSCLKLVPSQAPRRHVNTEEDNILLRYEVIMESNLGKRRFIMSFNPSSQQLSIYEPQVKNSGIIGGKFLEPTKIAKDRSTTQKPVYYCASDFYLGTVLYVFNKKFTIIGADLYVLKYMQQHANLYTDSQIEDLNRLVNPIYNFNSTIENQ